MATRGSAQRMVIVAGWFFLYAAMLGQAQTQTQQQAQEKAQPQTQRPVPGRAVSPVEAAGKRTTKSASQVRRRTSPPDDFAGLTFTDEQNAKIDQIREDIKPRLDAVLQDTDSSRAQKAAMIEGLIRTAHQELFEALTPEQQADVNKKMVARRALQQEQHKQKPLTPN